MKKVPRYKGLRIFLISIMLYYMLMSPILGMLYITNSPKLLKSKLGAGENMENQDTIKKIVQDAQIVIDSIKNIDSLAEEAGKMVDSLDNKSAHVSVNLNDQENNGMSIGNEAQFFNCLVISLILGFLYTLPFKIYFRRKRKGLKIPARIELFCRKTILFSPQILAGIIAIPFIFQNINLINQIFISDVFTEAFQKKMSLQYWTIFILAGMLTIAFVYYWQKHNMQIVYVQHIFNKEELKKRIFRKKSGKIAYRLVLTSFLTTLLPLSIVVAYLLMSLTSLSDIGLYEPTSGELKVIFGQYYEMIKNNNINELTTNYNLKYINVVDSFLLFIGIGAGIFVTIIYVMFFVHWTNSDIINPVKELLLNMQKTTGGQLENYSLVRTNDELGDLSENYNIMTGKLYEYISHIDKMNAELEQKVKERTAEIQSQKEEIEAQRDEVESQRDEIERQRDYVIEQRDLIISQKKAITDSIEYAANIQSAILPPLDVMNKILKDYFIYFKPRDIVSGDFYWAYKIKKKGENRVIVVVADSTGHGVPGAFMSMLGIALLNEIILKKGIYKPSEILDNLKENLVNSLHQTNEIGKTKDGMDMAVCLIDFERMELQYAGAYNPVYLVRDNKYWSDNEFLKEDISLSNRKFDHFGGKTLVELKADKISIGGAHSLSSNYTLHRFDLKPNDVIYMFSDGYADQFGGPRRLKYLYSRFRQFLCKISDESMEKQSVLLDREFFEWKGAEKQIDDILVIGIRIN
jgi:serine phosphatase RsbU (regulator of sigma subunit)